MSARIKPAAASPPQVSTPGKKGALPNFGGSIWAHRPKTFQAFSSFYQVRSDEAELEPRLSELVRLRIAFHNQCRTCMALRYAPESVSEGDVCSLEKPEEAPDLTPRERATLHFADLFAINHLAIDDKVFEGLREHFNEGELVELSIWCAVCVGFGRMGATWHLTDELPESFKANLDGRETPWGHDDAYVVFKSN